MEGVILASRSQRLMNNPLDSRTNWNSNFFVEQWNRRTWRKTVEAQEKTIALPTCDGEVTSCAYADDVSTMLRCQWEHSIKEIRARILRLFYITWSSSSLWCSADAVTDSNSASITISVNNKLLVSTLASSGVLWLSVLLNSESKFDLYINLKVGWSYWKGKLSGYRWMILLLEM